MGVIYGRLEKSIIWLIIALSTAAALGVITHLHVSREYLDFLIAILAALQIAFDYGSRAHRHKGVARSCCEILSEIEAKVQAKSADLADWRARFALLRPEDGMQMRAMAAVAFNEAVEFCVADLPTRRRLYKRTRWWHRVFRHVYPFKGIDFDPKEE
jgi:hypothetical protein